MPALVATNASQFRYKLWVGKGNKLRERTITREAVGPWANSLRILMYFIPEGAVQGVDASVLVFPKFTRFRNWENGKCDSCDSFKKGREKVESQTLQVSLRKKILEAIP